MDRGGGPVARPGYGFYQDKRTAQDLFFRTGSLLSWYRKEARVLKSRNRER